MCKFLFYYIAHHFVKPLYIMFLLCPDFNKNSVKVCKLQHDMKEDVQANFSISAFIKIYSLILNCFTCTD